MPGFYREKVGDQVGTIPVGRKGQVELYQVGKRQGTQGWVVDEYELWVGSYLLAIIRDHIKYSAEEVPLEVLLPFQPTL